MKKNVVAYIITIILSILYIFIFNKIFCKDLNLFTNNDVIKVKVMEIISIDSSEYQLGLNDVHEEKSIYFKGKIINGSNKGKVIDGVQKLNDIYAGNQEQVKVGNKVLLMKSQNIGDAQYLMTEYVRSDYLLILAVIFLLFLIIFGHKKGLNTILSLIFTCLAIFLVFIPSVLAGRSIYLWSIITCLFIILMTLLLINNLSKKTLCACLSCIVGVSLTALLTLIMSKIMSLTGILDEQSYYLQLMDTSKPFDLNIFIILTESKVEVEEGISIDNDKRFSELK